MTIFLLTEEYQAELGKYAKNYLPILFNVYTSEENESSDDHQVVIDTVRDYLKVTDQQVRMYSVYLPCADQQVRTLCTYRVPFSRIVHLVICVLISWYVLFVPCVLPMYWASTMYMNIIWWWMYIVSYWPRGGGNIRVTVDKNFVTHINGLDWCSFWETFFKVTFPAQQKYFIASHNIFWDANWPNFSFILCWKKTQKYTSCIMTAIWCLL